MARRLAAIMFTDIAGYTAQAQADEAEALKLLQAQEKLVRPILEAHRGRKVKSMGDGLLIEFPDALDAVECGVELQRRMHEHNSEERARRLVVRIGIHLGDVQRRGTDILGDAVNIASRIEPLAEPGGVCLSAQVYDQVHNKVAMRLEKLGPKALKGVREPVDVYRVELPWLVPEVSSGESTLPRLAVLPLANISPDPKDEYIADGLTEELISTLSGIRGLRVIAHTSVNRYKGSTVPVSRIGAELGISSLLEGSVRKAGNRLRISLQLIDVGSQEHTWTANYDRSLDDVFAIQADVAEQTAAALRVELRKAEGERLRSKPVPDSESYLLCLKAENLSRTYTEDGLKRAQKLLEKAIALDGSNARAYVGLARNSLLLSYYLAEPGRRIDQERAWVQKALELDGNLPLAHMALADILRFETDFAAAKKEYELALSLDPSCAAAHHEYGLLLEDMGRTDEALRELTLAVEANPFSTASLWMRTHLLACLGRMEEAETMLARLSEVEGRGSFWHTGRQFLAEIRGDTPGIVRELKWGIRTEENLAGRLADEAELLLVEGRRAEMTGVMERLRACASDPRRKASLLAELYAKRNELDNCFEWIEELLRLHGLEFLIWRMEPQYANVRADPRYQELLRRLFPA